MRLPLPKKSQSGTVGLDLDGRFLSAVQAGDKKIARAVSSELPVGLIKDGEVVDVEGLSEAIKGFFKEAGLPSRVRLGVSNQQIVVRHLELPPIANQTELAAAIRFQAAEAIAMPLDEAVLDHQVLGETTAPDGSTRLRVLVVAARTAMIERFVDSVSAAGLKAEGVDLNAFALVRALSNDSTETAADQATVYCHLGGVTNLAIAVGSSCLFTRPLSTDWDDEGEHVAAVLAEEIRLSIDYYMAQPNARPAGEVKLSGPGARIEGLAEQLEPLIHLPVSVAAPLGALAHGELGDEDPYRHTVAAGLAIGAAA